MENEKKPSLLQERYQRMIELYKAGNDALPKLADLYYLIGADIGLYNDLRRDLVRRVRFRKTYLKQNNQYKSVAEFDRDFEESDEFILDREYKFCIRGLETMMMSVGLRVKSLQAEKKGQY